MAPKVAYINVFRDWRLKALEHQEKTPGMSSHAMSKEDSVISIHNMVQRQKKYTFPGSLNKIQPNKKLCLM